MIRQAEAAVADGHRALKMYPLAKVRANGTLCHSKNRYADDKSSIREAINLVSEVRRTVGPDIELMLDLAGGLSIGDMVWFGSEVAEFDIAFMEEVNDPGDLGALKQIAAKTNIPIATGERQYLRHGFRDLLEARAVSIIQPDIGNTGGIAEAHKIASMADAYGVKVQPHVCGSSVAASIAAHFSASISNFYIQEHFPYWAKVPGWIEVANEPFEHCLRDGVLPISDEPGFGVTLNEAVVREHIWEEVC